MFLTTECHCIQIGLKLFQRAFINALKSKMYVVCYAETLSKLRNKSIWKKLVHYIEPEKLFSF